MAKQDATYTRDYNQGYQDMLNGDVDTAYAEYWTPGYKQGVHDMACNFAGV